MIRRLAAALALLIALEGVAPAKLVAWWRLDETSGTTLKDSSGNGHDATLSGSYTLGAVAAPAIRFGNTSAVTSTNTALAAVPSPTFITPNGTVTFAFWVKFASTATQVVIDFASPSSRIAFIVRSSALGVEISTSGLLVARSTVATGVWTHYAFTWDGTTNSWYVNGALFNTSTIAHETTAFTVAGFLQQNGGGTVGLRGDADDIRIYDAALTAAQVAGLYAGGPEDHALWFGW